MADKLMPRFIGIQYYKQDNRVWDITPIPDDYELGKQAISRWENSLGMSDNSEKFTAYIYDTSEGRTKIHDRWIYSTGCWESKLGTNSHKLFILKAQGKIISLKRNANSFKKEWQLQVQEGEDVITVAVSEEVMDGYNKLVEGFKTNIAD